MFFVININIIITIFYNLWKISAAIDFTVSANCWVNKACFSATTRFSAARCFTIFENQSKIFFGSAGCSEIRRMYTTHNDYTSAHLWRAAAGSCALEWACFYTYVMCLWNQIYCKIENLPGISSSVITSTCIMKTNATVCSHNNEIKNNI